MDRRVPVAGAVEGAGRLLESGWGVGLKPEERLRRAIAACALERPDVLEVRLRPEWRPAMNLWPSKPKNPLGGFDLAFRMKGDGGPTVAAETKWSGGQGFDALDQTPWDVLKLVHARATVSGVRWALLITAAPVPAWISARFAHIFGETTTPIMELLTLNPNMHKEDSKSRPLALPPYIKSSPAGHATFLFEGKEWEIRVASIRGNGDPWLECDEEGWPREPGAKPVIDWPYPDPGLGMLHDDGDPVPEEPNARTPRPDATWTVIVHYAHRFNGYRTHGDGLADMANATRARFEREGTIEPTLPLDDLRACLFFEARRYHHFGHAPGYDGARYVRALVAAIETLSAAEARPR